MTESTAIQDRCTGATTGADWSSAGTGRLEMYVRFVVFSGAVFLVVCTVPVAAKWILIGRWRPQRIRIWSLAYVRFWIVKTLIRSNPGALLFIGSPLYGLYLRALGAKVGPRVVIFSRRIPVCTDLLTIGAGTVIRRESIFLWGPVLQGGVGLLFLAVSSLVEVLDPSVHASTGALTLRGLFIEALAFSVVLFFGAVLIGLVAVGTVPRVLSPLIKPDTVYP